MKIYIKNSNNLNIPTKASELAAGYDIVAINNPTIVGSSIIHADNSSTWDRIDYIEYETGLYLAPEIKTYHYLIHPRSSISKYNLVLANSIGLIDNDYRGQIICRFKYIWQPEDFTLTTNSTSIVGKLNYNKLYKKGDKIGQLVFEPTISVVFEPVDDLNTTSRGTGGFGSTGQ